MVNSQINNKSFSNWDNYTPIEDTELESEYSVYPNPAKDHLYIAGSFSELDRISPR
jgi:hypothetical protein